MATIRLEQRLPHPPSRVWSALTDPAMLAGWLMPNDFLPRLGHGFSFDTGGRGRTQCEVVELTPGRRVADSWRNPPLDTIVTWTVTPDGDGTLLTLEHSGFDLDDPRQRFAHEGMSSGWGSMLAGRLPSLLAGTN